MKFPLPSNPSRLFGLALVSALASGVALAAWAATDDLPPHRPPPMMMGLMLPHGPLLDHVLDDVKASPAQRAQTHQILDAADADLRAGRDAARADHDQMATLFAQPVVDAAAVEAVRQRVEARRDAESRRMTQAMVDVSQVLSAEQRQQIVHAMSEHARPLPGARPPIPAALQ